MYLLKVLVFLYPYVRVQAAEPQQRRCAYVRVCHWRSLLQALSALGHKAFQTNIFFFFVGGGGVRM